MSARQDGRSAAPAASGQPDPAAAPQPRGWQRLFRRPRLLAEVRFAFGAALVMAAAGIAVAFGMPPMRVLPSDAPAVRAFVQAAVGFGLGWWGGLFWGAMLGMYARGFRPLPPVPALMPATWLAAVLVAGIALATRALGGSVIASIGAGVVAGTLAARLLVGRASRKAGA